jgi:hypothetical protein
MSSSDALFRDTIEFNPKLDIGPGAPSQLTQLISSHPDLKVYTRSSPHFQNLKAIWNLQYTTNEPLALIRATSTSDISTVVKYCVSNKIPFTVRSGGHDLWGRSVVPGTVILDIRELNQIHLAEDRKSVTIGGGAQTGPMVDFLDAKGLVTPCTLASVVGHLGWAFMGGFGPLVNTFGLGVDQIIGAKIVTADGEEREADSELLWGIKGAGGAFGVITEVKIKTYELPKLLGGMLMFQFDQAEKTIEGVKSMLETETIPAPLSLGFHFSKRGGVPVLSMMFSWVSTDIEEGRKWLDRIKSFGTVVMDMVGESMLPPFSINSFDHGFTADWESSNYEEMVRPNGTHAPSTIIQHIPLRLPPRPHPYRNLHPLFCRPQNPRRCPIRHRNILHLRRAHKTSSRVIILSS